MKKTEFNQFIRSKLIYLDGATGSNLIQAGMPIGVCPEQWILENKQVLYDLQKEYAVAGANIVYASTFTCNRIKLAEYGLADKLYEMNRELVDLTKSAVGPTVLVAGDITMTGEQLEPMGTLKFEELVDIYKEQVDALYKAGVDLFVIETMMSLQETRAAIIAIKEQCDLPFLVTMTFESNGKCLYGTDPITAAVVIESLGASAVGANCSTGPKGMIQIIETMKEHVSIPIIAKPNAGIPSITKENLTIYEQTPETFANEMKQVVTAGATVIGGCCGTTTKHIKTLIEETKKINFSYSYKKNEKRYLTSETKTISFGLDDPFMIIGERINPTGKKKLQTELKEGIYDLAIEYAQEQERNQASLLDINVGMSGIDEEKTMLTMIQKISAITNLPLVIDSSYTNVIEKALRIYPGRALINSISLETEKIDVLLPIAKKYGAMFILLPLSDAGLPKSMDEKINIINKILKKASDYGLTKRDILVDGLVTTIGANKNAANETLETILFCKNNELATTIGLSNISFGLPDRSYLNSAFLNLAIGVGLTTAIANPSQDLLTSGAFATDLLLNKQHAAQRYIDYSNQREPIEGFANQKLPRKINKSKKNTITINSKHLSTEELVLYNYVLKGQKENAILTTKKLLHIQILPKIILDTILIPAIDQVGLLFDKGTYFLPQLIAGAEAMKACIDVLEPYLMADKSNENGIGETIVIATVKGDIHDIGKNLVALMLKIYGYHVIDLGKDVSKEEIIEQAIQHNAKIIGLSALMTTTMVQMKEVISYAKEKKCDAKFMVGGAVITEEYAKEIGANVYAKDAASSVLLAKELLQKENGSVLM